MSPEFSVVVPTRGDSPHLRAALASALAAAPGAEVLLVRDPRGQAGPLPPGDGASDRVRAWTARTSGPAACRNEGIDAAHGRLVAFLDDDDVWLPDHLVRCRSLLERHPSAVLVAGDAYLFRDETPDGSAPIPADRSALPRFRRRTGPELLTSREMLLANPVLTPTVVLRRERLRESDRFREDLPVMEDYDLWLRLAAREPLLYDDTPSVVVRRRRGSARTALRSMAEQGLRVLEAPLAAGVASGVVTERERRKRLGKLWHDLAYACLREGDGKCARAAARRSAALLPGYAKTYIYWVGSMLLWR